MYRRPIVTLIGNGDQVTLDGVGSEFTLKPGMTGTGTAPREFSFAELARGGSTLRHRRNSNIEIMIPIDVFHGYGPDAYGKLEDSRRRLENICDGLVEVRLETKDGYRSAFGYLKDGLEGDFSKAVVNHCRMNLPLTFECPDAWWYGAEQVLTQKVDPGRKPFITSKIEPVAAGLVNLWRGSKLSHVRSAIASTTEGSTAVQTASGLKVTTGTPPSGAYSLIYTNTPYRVPVEPGKTYSWRIPIKNHGPSSFPVSLLTWINGTTTGDTSASESFTLAPGEQRDVVIEDFSAKSDAKDIRFSLYYGASASKPAEGTSFEILDGITLTQTEKAQDSFNGDTLPRGGSAFGWAGERYASPSVEYVASSVQRAPFFPVTLASSTVEGAYVLDIQGDAEAWPIWEVTGPGEDLLIEDVIHDRRIFIKGEFGETVTLDARAGDIFSDTFTRGELWNRASIDTDLFALTPGRNRIKITMVNARPESVVRLRYRETFRAGH